MAAAATISTLQLNTLPHRHELHQLGKSSLLPIRVAHHCQHGTSTLPQVAHDEGMVGAGALDTGKHLLLTSTGVVFELWDGVHSTGLVASLAVVGAARLLVAVEAEADVRVRSFCAAHAEGAEPALLRW